MSARLILLTGVSRGLGRALVERFVESGHTVVGCGRSESARDELAGIHPAPHRFDPVDVSEDTQVRDWAKRVLVECGTPDLVINNAATINANAPLWEVSAETFSEVLDVNIKGVTNVIRHFVPAMIERGTGVVVNFSSGWGRSTSAEVAPYCATKWAVEGLTQALAQELPRGLAAIPLNPGVINTDMLQSCFGASTDGFPDADEWSRVAAPFLLGLEAADSGEPLTVPI